MHLPNVFSCELKLIWQSVCCCTCSTCPVLWVNHSFKNQQVKIFLFELCYYTLTAHRGVVTTYHSLWQHFILNNRQSLLNNLKPYFNLLTTHLGVQTQLLNNTVSCYTGVGENVLFLSSYIHQQHYKKQIKGKLDLIMSFSKG